MWFVDGLWIAIAVLLVLDLIVVALFDMHKRHRISRFHEQESGPILEMWGPVTSNSKVTVRGYEGATLQEALLKERRAVLSNFFFGRPMRRELK